MKYFATLTGKGELMYFQAEAYQEANYICGGFEYIEIDCGPHCRVKEADELVGYERELYRRLKNRDYSTLKQQ